MIVEDSSSGRSPSMVSTELGQIARVLEEQPLGRRSGGLGAAELVEHDEAVAVLEHATTLDRAAARGRDVEGRDRRLLATCRSAAQRRRSDRLPATADAAAISRAIDARDSPRPCAGP